MRSRKVLVIDGIGGVPLGREICEAINFAGVAATHFDCLAQAPRSFYRVRSAYAKARDRASDKDSFTALPKLPSSSLRELLEQENPSDVLVIGFVYKFFAPHLLRKLADSMGMGVYLYDTDSCNLYSRRREFVHFIENELPVYDRVFSFSRVTTRLFRETRGLDAVHLPFAATPLDLPAADQKSDALFVGSCDLRRIFLLEAIHDKVTVFGNRWQRNWPLISPALRARINDKSIWGADLRRLFAGSKVIINITRSDFFGAETGVNLRIFECLAAGRFLLTDHCDEVVSLFKPGVEIETFSSSAELSDKLNFYLANDESRESIARRGHQAFLQSHTWRRRAAEMLALMQRQSSVSAGKTS